MKSVITNPFWDISIYLGFAFLPVSFYHFVLNFIAKHHLKRWQRLKILYVISLALLIVISEFPDLPPLWYKVILLLYLAPVSVYCAYLLIHRYFKTFSRVERTQIGIMLFGMGTAMVLGLLEYMASFGLSLPKLGNVGAFVFSVSIATAIIRYRLLDVGVFVGRTLMLVLLTTFFWLIYGLLSLFGVTSFTVFFNILLAVVFLFIVYEPLKKVVDNLTDKVLQKDSFDFQKLITNCTKEMVSIIDMDLLFYRTYSTLMKADKLGGCSIYMREREAAEYQLVMPREATSEKKRKIEKDKPFIQYLKTYKRILVKEELERELSLYHVPSRKKSIRAVIRAMNWFDVDLTVPFIFQGKLHGFLNLKGRDSEVVFNKRERELLLTLANQLAISIAHAKLYEKMKRNDRLIALGEMSTGLAHEIRNPLGSIKATAQYLKPLAIEESGQEFLQIIIEEVDRLDKFLENFLEYARPMSQKRSLIQPNTIIEKTIALIKNNRQVENIDFNIHLSKSIPDLYLDDEMLRQVLWNLILNSIQAMPDGGILTVATALLDEEEHEIQEVVAGDAEKANSTVPGYIYILIKDTGIGFSSEVFDKLFIPFFTTKERGTGLGLPTAQKIIQGYNGRIEVQSEEGKGAEFRIILPMPEEPEPEADVENPMKEAVQ